ncbi:Multicopper oxidase with three cupredoxin domains (includes cell division protein FtsP and spore coat protein CotA) [Ruegeria halocynthiae]|uniref:Multicopper oxidase with three cupredoxin domains (Includes cell division protein FtsP and spore coat protein CotA) n=1 Tax=Ruegeria halocynthiae TaxID=985054 RepID=A0A1H3CX29_9RHOB|nr:multicopper oxidase family protein [Ruegeria halocynthiae]SDX58772.1 Multicopper oxidase with three cupredoxin domains (includes cell division protein FtsP and spore coat protein CotA) [Ruegeria halocynthiae]
MKRREFLLGSGAAAGALGLGGFALASGPQELAIQPASFSLREQVTEGMVSLSPDAPPPVLYGKQGEVMRLPVRNTLPDYTAMHWHGLRIANQMDGVPYLTQIPMGEGETFHYEFTPPDAGTYWYHPHCMTMEQMAHGLTGVMVITEAEDPGFNSEQVINLRDFRLDDAGAFLPAYTPRGAARAGTFGNVHTANWMQAPAYDHAAGSLVRLRVVNTDTTRIYKLHLDGAGARIIAWDGHPVEIDVPMPSANDPLLVGPGQRVDFAVRMPESESQTINLMAKLPGQPMRAMARLRALGASVARDLRELSPLVANPVAKPNLDNAQLHEFVFGWTPEGGEPNNGFCGSLGYNFWSINRTPWPGDAAQDVGPLATLEMDKSYVLRLRNESPNLHPIHLHGLAFIPIKSNLRTLPPLMTDTMLLLKDEVVEIALVADNPGDWAFHCHVIEHQKTGLTGFIRVV